jgi:hypothetical protein
MGTELQPRDPPVSDHLHPLVYIAIMALAAWFAIAAWGFATDGYTDYLLAVVSGFILIAVGLPYALSRIWRKTHPREAVDQDRKSFGEWASGQFATWQDRTSGANAAVEVLLPIAVAAFGMTAFGIVLHIAAHSAA